MSLNKNIEVICRKKSILEDPESPTESLSALSEVDSEPDGPSSSLCQCVETEVSGSDLLEESKVQKFLSDTCNCHLAVGNKACSLTFTVDDIRHCRQLCSVLTHNELDLVIMSQVHYYRTTQRENDQIRPVSNYYFNGVKI